MKTIKNWALLFVALFLSVPSVHAAVTVEPITWNVIGLDSNKPDTVQPSPEVFPPDRYPVGVEVCNTSTTDTESSLKTVFVWDENPMTSYIELWYSTGTGDTEAFTELTVPELAPGQCADVYYFVKIDRVKAAYDFTRDYYIEVWDDPTTPNDTATNGTELVATPQPRELYVEYLVSQNRNAILGYTVNGTAVSPGDSIPVKPGDIIELVIDAKTATQGYEQLEVFMALPPDLFTINTVQTTYSANSGTDADAGNQLYADGCGWENDPDSGNYHNNLSCGGTGKYGGRIQQTVIMTVSNAFSSDVVGQTLIYDFSGSSYHYNSDYEGGELTFTFDATPSTYDVSLNKTAVDTGGSGNGTYTVTLTAIELPNGTDPIAEEIVVGDYLPDGYNVKGASGVGSNVTASSGSIRFCISPGVGCVAPGAADQTFRYIEWTVAASTLTAGNLSETLEINFVSVSGFSSANPDDYTNCARVDDASGDGDATNNEACTFFAFAPEEPVDLSVQKSVQSVDLGVDPARVTFELVVTNETGGALSAVPFGRSFGRSFGRYRRPCNSTPSRASMVMLSGRISDSSRIPARLEPTNN